ncbi:hypothetical protein U1Q18_013291 [Sarracenia purpurea var. burkii]
MSLMLQIAYGSATVFGAAAFDAVEWQFGVVFGTCFGPLAFIGKFVASLDRAASPGVAASLDGIAWLCS